MNPERNPDDYLEILLSRGRLVGPVSERLEERILERYRSTGPRRMKKFAMAMVPAAALGLVIFVSHRTERPAARSLEFRSKGANGQVSFGISCSEGSASRCTEGSRLFVTATGLEKPLVISAFALTERNEKVWYFSQTDGNAQLIPEQNGVALSSRGVLITPSHPRGRMTLILFAGASALPRPQMLKGTEVLDGAFARIPFEVVAQ